MNSVEYTPEELINTYEELRDALARAERGKRKAKTKQEAKTLQATVHTVQNSLNNFMLQHGAQLHEFMR